MTISVFNVKERVRILDEREDPYKIYIIKKISRSHNGIILYILESESNQVSRLYYETEDSFLERIELAKIS